MLALGKECFKIYNIHISLVFSSVFFAFSALSRSSALSFCSCSCTYALAELQFVREQTLPTSLFTASLLNYSHRPEAFIMLMNTIQVLPYCLAVFRHFRVLMSIRQLANTQQCGGSWANDWLLNPCCVVWGSIIFMFYYFS